MTAEAQVWVPWESNVTAGEILSFSASVKLGDNKLWVAQLDLEVVDTIIPEEVSGW